MRKARFTEEQMVAVICEADREPVALGNRDSILEELDAFRRQLNELQTLVRSNCHPAELDSLPIP